MENKLHELDQCELIDYECGYKYQITCYSDVTEIKYIEKNDNKEWIEKSSYNISAIEDIQICEKIIEMRKRYNNKG